MKKYFLPITLLWLLSFGCKKEIITANSGNTPALNTHFSKNGRDVSLTGYNMICTLQYNGASGSTHFTVQIGPFSSNLANFTTAPLYLMDLNGNTIANLGSYGEGTWQFDYTLPEGTFYLNSYINLAYSQNFRIIMKPDNPPAGMLSLYRYFNPVTNRHIYTSDWNELGSNSRGYAFEIIQGYIYQNANAASNLLPLYRFYSSTANDYYLTTSSSGYSGYTLNKTLGYISSASAGTFIQQLNEYYNSATGHVYTSPPENLTSPYVFDNLVGYIQPNYTALNVFEFYNFTTAKHALSLNFNFPQTNSGYTYNNVAPFMAYTAQASGTVPVYQFYNSSYNDRVLTTNPNPSFPAGYNNTGVAFYANSSNVAGTVPIYEFYSVNGVDHFYSANRHAADPYPGWTYNSQPFYALPPTGTPQKIWEYYDTQDAKHAYNLSDNLQQNNPPYALNGQPFKAYQNYIPGTVAVYQFYNATTLDHVMTTNVNPGWAGYSLNGVLFYAYTTNVAGTVPLYEFYSSVKRGDHWYSTNRNAANGYTGWTYNGLPFYVIPNN